MSKSAAVAVISAGLVLAGALGATYATADDVGAKPSAAASRSEEPKPIESGEVVGVVDREGNEVGFVDAAAMDRANARIMDRMLDAGIEDTATITEDEAAAYQVIEAVPVTDADGELTGYLAGGYLTIEELEAAEPGARKVVEAVEARQHD